MVQYLSGLSLTLIHWYKQLLNTVKSVNTSPRIVLPGQRRGFALTLLECFSAILSARNRMTSSVIFDIMEYMLRLSEDFSDR